MKENKISIIIKSSPSQVFQFTLNPANTPKWIPSIVEEKTSEWPVKQGTVYRNRNKQGVWNEYELIQFEENKSFTMKQRSTGYNVRYTFRQISDGTTELIYLEWVDNGELEDPFTKDILDNLKSILEE